MNMSNGFLSQDEINALLNGESATNNPPEKEKGKDEGLEDIEKDLLGEIGNISMGSASTALYQIINQNVNITTPIVSMATLEEIKMSFDTPTVVIDVEFTSGIVGRNILIIHTSDAAVIANLMMGGDGKIENQHELSEIEISAVQEAMNQMIGSAATSMAQMFGREVNISPPNSKIWGDKSEKLSEIIPEDEKLVKISFTMTIGDLIDSNIMQILPLKTAKKIVSIMMGNEDTSSNEKTVEDIKEKEVSNNKEVLSVEKELEYSNSSNKTVELQNHYEPKPITQKPDVEVHSASFESLAPTNNSLAPKNIDLILDVPLDISVVLGRTKKSIKDILGLGTGSLIELDKLAEEPVEILVNGKKIAFGEVVVVDENFGVRITSIISNIERIKSLN